MRRRYRIFDIEQQRLKPKFVLHQNGSIFENGNQIKKSKLFNLKVFFDIGVKYKDGNFAIEGDVIDFDMGYGVIMMAYGYPTVKFRTHFMELCSLVPISKVYALGSIFDVSLRNDIAKSFDFQSIRELCSHFGVKFPCYTRHKT